MRAPEQHHRNSISKKDAGIALVSVLFIMAILSVLAFTLSYSAVSEQKATRANNKTEKLIQIADSASERARVKIYEAYKQNHYTQLTFLDLVREELAGEAGALTELSGVHSITEDGIGAHWEISAVSPADSEVGWIEISSTAIQDDKAQTVIKKIGFGEPGLFELALLTETVNCMFCHLQVNGDVGTLAHFRPGWGSEGVDGVGSGGEMGGSRIDGNIYAATSVSGDDRSTTKVNGAVVNGSIYEDSRSSKLPQDLDGDNVPDFPPIRREVAEANALGQISINASASDGALIRTFGLTGNATAASIASGNATQISENLEGHAILIGTAANPINLDEDVYVSGDVIIKGVVTGTGAIYSGRNIYIAGDVTLKNPPHKPGQGVCSGKTDPDECAKANIAADKDALRLGARGNIIIGDYTEYRSNDLMSWSERQSSDFYRAQFGFHWGMRYYDKRNGDELECLGSGASQVCKNIDGDEVPTNKIKAVNAQGNIGSNVMGDEAYDYSFRPGIVKTNGDFDSWMSDELYRDILGRERFDHNTFRWGANAITSESEFKDQVKESINAVLLNDKEVNNATLNAAWTNRWNSGYTPIYTKNGEKVGEIHSDGWTFRFLIEAEAEYETQVNRVEAFLYANKRIAGKSSMQAVAVNGGMIAQELGVLAQGRKLIWPWWKPAKEKCTTTSDPYFVADTEVCALTVNYDYRLRNGGFGFNLVSGETGKTLSWRLAEQESERVLPAGGQ